MVLGATDACVARAMAREAHAARRRVEPHTACVQAAAILNIQLGVGAGRAVVRGPYRAAKALWTAVYCEEKYI